MLLYDLTTEPCSVYAQYRSIYKRLSRKEDVYTDGAITVRLVAENGEKRVLISSKKPFKKIILRWKREKFSQNDMFYGDVCERNYGTLGWRKRKDDDRFFWYFAESNGEETAAWGVKTGCSCFASWQTKKDEIILTADCRNGSFPVVLGNRELHACTIVCTLSEKGETTFATLRRFCKMMCPNPVLPKKPVYGSNNWYYAYGKDLSAELFKADADLLAETTDSLENRPYCVLDDGWMDTDMNLYRRCDGEAWVPDEIKFPDMKEVTDYIHAKNMKAGIWFRPLLATLQTPDYMILGARMLEKRALLDPSVPETLERVKEVVRRIKGWGFDLIKHDFSFRDMTGVYHHDPTQKLFRYRKYHDRSKTTAEITLDLYRAIREEAGDDVVIIGCNTVSHLSAGLFELCRTGDDTSGYDFKKVLTMGVPTATYRAHQHNAFYACDADCVGHTGKIPWEQNREWLRLLAESGTPLFTSIDPRLVTDEIKKDLVEAYRLASEQKYLAEPMNGFDKGLATKWRVGDSVEKFDWYKR